MFIANIDEAKNHYDVRSIYSSEMGIALANQMDKHVLQEFIKGALVTTPDVTGEADMVGTVIDRTNAGLQTPSTDSFKGAANGANLVKAIFAMAQKFDEKNVPADGRFVIVKPAEYYALSNLDSLVSSFYGAKNAYGRETGRIFEIAGMEIVKSNNLPTTNVNTSPAQGDSAARHAVDASDVVAVCGHASGVGTVKLLDLATEMEYQISRQGTLMVGKYAMGHGVLRAEACGIIKDVQGS